MGDKKIHKRGQVQPIVIRITEKELVIMPHAQYRTLITCLEEGAFRLLGIFWVEYIRHYVDSKTNDIVIEYV